MHYFVIELQLNKVKAKSCGHEEVEAMPEDEAGTVVGGGGPLGVVEEHEDVVLVVFSRLCPLHRHQASVEGPAFVVA